MNQDPIGLLGEDNLDAHEILRNAFLNDSPLMTITNRQGSKGNPAMRLTQNQLRQMRKQAIKFAKKKINAIEEI